MILENNRTGTQSPSHRRDQNDVYFIIFDYFSSLFCLLDTLFSDLNIKIDVWEFVSKVFLSISVIRAILLQQLITHFIESGFCVADEMEHLVIRL